MKTFTKKLTSVFLSILMLTGMLSAIPVQAQEATMKIYGIYLESKGDIEPDNTEDRTGDAVLLESSGKYLLMDTGSEGNGKDVVSYLKKKKITNLDIYISHTHADHRGALAHILTNFKVGKVYLPNKSIGSDYVNENGVTQADVYDYITKLCSENKAKIVYLKKGSKFTVGSASAEVLGPVGKYTLNQFTGHKSGHYLNNYSLTTMITCNGKKFLTTGDIEKEEEAALVKKYGSKLKADILKLPHHGLTTTSNTEQFIDAVKPTYAFAENSDYIKPTKVTKKMDGKSRTLSVSKAYTAIERVGKYGLTYLVGNEGHSAIFDCQSSKINFYTDKNDNCNADSGELNSGWVSVCGITQKSYNDYTGKNYFYISNGKILTGVQKINKKYYYLGTGGIRETGVIQSNGSFSGYRSYGKNVRYYNRDASMNVGFTKINGYTYYYDKKGFRVVGDSNWKIVTIEGKKYALNANGVVYNNKGKGGWLSYNKAKTKTKIRYFNKNGVMATGWLTIGGSTYYMNTSSGLRSYGVVNIGSKAYYFNDSGKLRKSTTVKLGKTKVKLNSKGQITSPLPSKVTKLKVSAKKGKTTISWKKSTKNTNGYIIYRSTSKNGQYKAIKTITSASTVKYTDTSTKKGKKYYYKVCAYKTIQGTKVSGSYSSIVNVKAK